MPPLAVPLTRVAATWHARASAPHVAPLLHRAHPSAPPRHAAPNAKTRADARSQDAWLKTHRRDWYTHHLRIRYSTRAATFSSTDRRGSRDRRLTGLEGPSASALFQTSFAQPDDVDAENGGLVQDGHANGSPALAMPRASPHKDDVQSPEEDEFVDAVSEPDDDLRVYTHQEEPERQSGPSVMRRQSTRSFVTASSIPLSPSDEEDNEAIPLPHDAQAQAQAQTQVQASGSEVPTATGSKSQGKRPLSPGLESNTGEPSVDAVSTTSLLRKADSQKASSPVTEPISPAKGLLAKAKRKSHMGSSESTGSSLERAGETLSRKKSNLRNLVKFEMPEDSKRASIHLRAKQAQMTVQRASSKLRRRKIKDGLVVKMERMLVRVDSTGKEVPDDFDENASQKIDSRVKDKWREYMVVCRHSESEDAEFVLQMYKTRVSALLIVCDPELIGPGHSRDRRA